MPTRQLGMIGILLAICGVGSVRLPAADWPCLGRDFTGNPVSPETNPPTDWDVETGRNIKWKADIASLAFSSAVVSEGLVWVGGNRWRLRKDDPNDDALLLCFDEQTGEKLYEYVSPRLQSKSQFTDPRIHGLGCSPLIEGDRLWFVTNRCEAVCLNIAPLKAIPRGVPQIVWKVDMREEFGVVPRREIMGPGRLCSISPSYQGLILVSTCNGVDESHVNIPAPQAPGLICFDKETGEAKWQVPTSVNVLVSESASPLVADIAGRGQVVMPHGDGWVRSYDPRTGRLLWEFDVNFKEATYSVLGRCLRNYFTSSPVLFEDRIYIASGMSVEQGVGDGRLVCIDPTRSGDISSELAVDNEGHVLPPRRLQNVDARSGERAIPNPNSGLLWEYLHEDINGDDKIEYEEEMHRTASSVAIHNGLLIAGDSIGIVHCLDPRTGRSFWNYDGYAGIWGSALIVDGNVYVGSEDGSVYRFLLSPNPEQALTWVNGQPAPIAEIDMGWSVYAAPTFANGVLYVTTRSTLYAIQQTTTEQ